MDIIARIALWTRAKYGTDVAPVIAVWQCGKGHLHEARSDVACRERMRTAAYGATIAAAFEAKGGNHNLL